MAEPTIQLGGGNWAGKSGNLLGYYEQNKKFYAEDFTFSRSTSGTRVNSSGLIETASVLGSDLVTNGNFATDSDWTKGSGWSISGGKANQDNSTPNSGDLTQSNVTTSGKKYKVTFDLVVTSGTISVLVGGHNLFTSSGTKTFIKTATSSNLTFRNYSNFIGSIDNVSVKEVIENDIPRVDYLNNSNGSLILEPQRTNIVPYTEDFSQWGAINSNRTLINNTNPIDSNAYEIESSVTSSASRIYYSAIMTAGNDYSSTYLVKPSLNSPEYLGFACISNTQPDVLYDFANDQFVDFNIVGNAAKCESISMNNGWKLLKVPIHESVGNSRLNIYQGSRVGNNLYGTTGESYYIKFAQLEQGNYTTSYIPTNGSTVTRTADVCNNAGTSATFNDSEGVLFVEIAALADDLTFRGISISDGTTANRIVIYLSDVSNRIRLIVRGNNVLLADLFYDVSDTLSSHKVAVKYKADDFALWIDGIEVATDLSGTSMPIGLNQIRFANADGGANFYGKCKQLIYFDQALTNDELEKLTTI